MTATVLLDTALSDTSNIPYAYNLGHKVLSDSTVQEQNAE
jgi:hypothetical protein